MPNVAWVSLVTNNELVPPVRVLKKSLETVGSRYKSHVYLTDAITEQDEKILEHEGWEVHRISNHTGETEGELKLRVLTELSEYDAVGFMPPGAMFHQNADHIFQCTLKSGAVCLTHYPEEGFFEHWDFDPALFLVNIEQELVEDMKKFVNSETFDKERQDLFNAYFYYYCKGNGYPIEEQFGEYSAPAIDFDCSKDENTDEKNECKLIKSVSSSPCYALPQSFNFHPYEDQLTEKSRFEVSIVQFRKTKPWQWRNVFLDGWQSEWNTFGPFTPDLFYRQQEELSHVTPHLHSLGCFVTLLFLSLAVQSLKPFFVYFTFLIKIFSLIQSFMPLVCLFFFAFAMFYPIYETLIMLEFLPLVLPTKNAWYIALEVIFTSTISYIGYFLAFLYSLSLISKMSYLSGETSSKSKLNISWSYFIRKEPKQGFPFLSFFVWSCLYCLSLLITLALLYLFRWMDTFETLIMVGGVVFVWTNFLLYRGVQLCADVYYSAAGYNENKVRYGAHII